jgi:hypothetical protein
MKKKILSLSVVIVLILGVLLSAAVMVAADSDDPNTVASSTMIFEGSLTDNGDGTYSGTVIMINEETAGRGDLEAGFDLYAKSGSKATYETGSGYACGIIVDYDAYTSAGGWGSFYDPDCADWYNYQLRFADGNWYLEYNNNVGNDLETSGASAPPMSGTMDWVAMYARETGAGEYYEGMGTPADDGYALDNTCTGTNDGAGAWDMDWSWGSEYIPLQYPGFDVTMVSLGGGNYRVKLVPAAAGSTQLTVEVPDIVAISVDPTSIDYGTLLPGQSSDEKNIVVTNIGTNKVKVHISVDSTGSVFDENLYLWKGGWQNPSPWNDFITGLVMNASSTVITQLRIPSSHPPVGDENATLLFEAEKDTT